MFSQEILSDLKIVEMETGNLAWAGWGRPMVVRQEVWAITLILGERGEKCCTVLVDRGSQGTGVCNPIKVIQSKI